MRMLERILLVLLATPAPLQPPIMALIFIDTPPEGIFVYNSFWILPFLNFFFKKHKYSATKTYNPPLNVII